MLLGCCHCESSVSSSSDLSSSDPSESTGSSSAGVVIIPTCGACINHYYPAALLIEIPAFGTSPSNCCPLYSGSFYAYHVGGASVVYNSVEKVVNVNTCLNTIMTTGPNPATRFTVSYRCARGLPLGTQTDIELNIRWSTTASSSAGALGSILYRYTNPSTASAIDCLQSVTLSKVVASTLTGPCAAANNAAWPTTINITPG